MQTRTKTRAVALAAGLVAATLSMTAPADAQLTPNLDDQGPNRTTDTSYTAIGPSRQSPPPFPGVAPDASVEFP